MQAMFVIEVFLVAMMKERKTGQINLEIFLLSPVYLKYCHFNISV